MNQVLRAVLCLAAGYGFGCISTGYLVGKWNHVDIRNYGSGNAGATNAIRTLGWKAGIITFLGDFFKAMIPMLLFRNVIFAGNPDAQLFGLIVGLGTVLGHNYPFWLKFKGGKGIAVTCGVMAAFDPLLVPFMFAGFVITVGLTKYVSLGSLVIAVMFPIWILIRYQGETAMLVIAVLYTASAFYRHRANIKRLMAGTENKLGQKVTIKKNSKEDKHES